MFRAPTGGGTARGKLNPNHISKWSVTPQSSCRLPYGFNELSCLVSALARQHQSVNYCWGKHHKSSLTNYDGEFPATPPNWSLLGNFVAPGREAQHWSRALSVPISCSWKSITPLVSLLVFADRPQLMHIRLEGVLSKKCQRSADEDRGLQSSHSEPWPSSKAVKYCKIQVWPPAIWKFQGTWGATHHT